MDSFVDASAQNTASGTEKGLPIPQGMQHAVSTVQKFYLFEKGLMEKGVTADSDFFTVDHIVAFSRVGMGSAFRDTVIWAVLFVFVGPLFVYFQQDLTSEQITQILFWEIQGSPWYWFAEAASFSGVAFSTVMACYMSRYYRGVLGRRAFNNLFVARSVVLVTIAFMVFTALGLWFKYILTDENIAEFSHSLSSNNSAERDKLYFFLYFYKRHIFESGVMAFLTAVGSTLLPVFTMLLFKLFRRRDEKLNVERGMQ